MFVRLQGAATGASSHYVTVVAAPKVGEKTSQAVCYLTEIALFLHWYALRPGHTLAHLWFPLEPG